MNDVYSQSHDCQRHVEAHCANTHAHSKPQAKQEGKWVGGHRRAICTVMSASMQAICSLADACMSSMSRVSRGVEEVVTAAARA